MAETLLRKKGEEERKKRIEKEVGKIFHKFWYTNRHGTNKLIDEGKTCILWVADKLYYKDIKKKFIPNKPISSRSLYKLLEVKLKYWKTDND